MPTNYEYERELRELFCRVKSLLAAETKQKQIAQAAVERGQNMKNAIQPSALALAFAANEVIEGRATTAEQTELVARFDQAVSDDMRYPVVRGSQTRVEMLKQSQLVRPLTPQAQARQNELLAHTALGKQILNGKKYD